MAGYALGKTFRFQVTCTVGGVATDPSALTLFVYKPASAANATYTLAEDHFTKSATGVYYIDLRLTEAGTWYFRWETNTEATEDLTITITASRFYSDGIM